MLKYFTIFLFLIGCNTVYSQTKDTLNKSEKSYFNFVFYFTENDSILNLKYKGNKEEGNRLKRFLIESKIRDTKIVLRAFSKHSSNENKNSKRADFLALQVYKYLIFAQRIPQNKIEIIKQNRTLYAQGSEIVELNFEKMERKLSFRERLAQKEPRPLVKKGFEISVSTNLLWDAMLSPSAELELRYDRYAFSIQGLYAPWSFGGSSDKKYLQARAVSPQLKYYFDRSQLFYTGVFYQNAYYNVKFNEIGKQGTLNSVGVSLGYLVPLSENVDIDLGLGMGYSVYNYDKYQILENNHLRTEHKKNFYIGPNKFSVSIKWKIGKQK